MPIEPSTTDMFVSSTTTAVMPAHLQLSGQASLTIEQLQVVEIVESVLNSIEHPYAKLNQLLQKGALSGLQQQKEGTSALSTVTVNATVVGMSEEIFSTKTTTGIKRAKQLAAQEVLDQVTQALNLEVPHRLCRQIPTPLPTSLTTAQNNQRKQDQEHVVRIQEILGPALVHLVDQSPHLEETGLLAIDLEMWERDHSINLEIGLSFTTAREVFNPTNFRTQHYINLTYMHLNNASKDLDQRDNFQFGTSEFVTDDDVVTRIEAEVEHLTSRCRKVYIIGHSINVNIAWLRGMGFTFMDAMTPLDIGKVYRWVVAPVPYNLFNMAKMLRGLGIPHKCLHNAGNDARHSLNILAALVTAAAWDWPEDTIDLSAH